MAETFIRAQLKPTGGSWQNLYTVGAGANRAILNTINASSPVDDTFGVSIAPAGAAYAASQDFVPNNMPINGPNTYQGTFGGTLLPGDVVRVYSGSGNVSFTLFADEIT